MEFKSRKDKKTKGLIYGYGVNDIWYSSEIREEFTDQQGKRKSKLLFYCYIHNSWKVMLRRVFVDNRYEDCLIQEEWLTYSNYYRWFISTIPNSNQDYVVDKDILSKGVSCYSENTCLFVPKKINHLISKSPKKRSNFLIGTYLDKSKASISWQGYYTVDGKRDMKNFPTEYSAHSHWRRGCIKNIKTEIDKIASGEYGKLEGSLIKELYAIIEDMTYTMIQGIPFKGFNLPYNEYLKGN